MKTIYLDNSATTKPSAAVIAAMTDALENGWYNPSALYRPAMDAEKAVENAREICLKAAGAANQRMVFTSGGTEADNIAILGEPASAPFPAQSGPASAGRSCGHFPASGTHSASDSSRLCPA